MKNLRGGISDVVNTLNQVRNASTDPDERRQLQRLLNVFFALWEEVIRTDIDRTTDEYRHALEALADAEQASNAALEDAQETAAAIRKATRAAQAIEEIVRLFADVLA